MPYNWYKIEYKKFSEWLLPKVWRMPVIKIIAQALVRPLQDVHTFFAQFRKAKIYQLKITPQVCYLKMLLNDRYDSTDRRIYIDDAIWHLPLFVYKEAENKPLYLYTTAENKPVIVYTTGESGIAKNDFVVYVPVSVSFDINEMKSLIDGFKLFGTKYTIQTF